MATRTCPQCEAQYVATVRRCIDCDVMLVDDAGPVTGDEAAGSSASPVGSGDQVGYELEGWGNQLKVTLEGMLARGGIGRVWEAGALVVSAADEDAVDDLIATLEGGDLPELPDDTAMVALEIEGLDADGHAELDARLLGGSVAHAWDDEGALVVAEAAEDQVLALIEEVLEGPSDEGDGLAAQDALSALYVAVDRLVKHPHDRKPATAYVVAARALDRLTIPYGFAASDWDDLMADVDRLAAAVLPHADVETSPHAAGEDDIDADDAEGRTDIDADDADGDVETSPHASGEDADDADGHVETSTDAASEDDADDADGHVETSTHAAGEDADDAEDADSHEDIDEAHDGDGADRSEVVLPDVVDPSGDLAVEADADDAGDDSPDGVEIGNEPIGVETDGGRPDGVVTGERNSGGGLARDRAAALALRARLVDLV